jgi:hypothetical protein
MGIERFLFHDVRTVDVLNPWQTKRESHFSDIWLHPGFRDHRPPLQIAADTPATTEEWIETLAATSIVVFCHGSEQLRPHKPTHIMNAPANPNKALWEKGDFTRIAETMR